MQGLTTKEPDDSMIEVAIQSVGAVFDWRVFLETSATDEKITKSSGSKNEGSKKAQLEEQLTTKKEAAGKHPVVAEPAHKEKRNTAPEAKTVMSEKLPTEASAKPASVAAKQSGSHNQSIHQDLGRSHTSNTPSIAFKPSVTNRPEDEDDEILKALDKFFDEGQKDGKSGEK
jgi:hypothetical protein